MSFLSRFGVGSARELPHRAVHDDSGQAAKPLHASATAVAAAANAGGPRSGRYSNGLKEFLSQLDGIRRGTLLDLGPPWQDTLNFFIERGFKVYTEDLLGSLGAFLREEEEQSRAARAEGVTRDTSGAARAGRFLSSNLQHSADSFDAILLWDSLDYLDRETVVPVVKKIEELVRKGGAMLAVFHMRLPEQLQRYRVLDGSNLELVPVAPLVAAQHVYQNREIQDLFHGFRTSKFFVGRDQLREGVFVK